MSKADLLKNAKIKVDNTINDNVTDTEKTIADFYVATAKLAIKKGLAPKIEVRNLLDSIN